MVYYQNDKSSAAGMITALRNRVGDAAVLISIGLAVEAGRWIFTTYGETGIIKYVVVFVILAAMTKRAQIPFSAWLPAAMAAPTPVRALVHSSTLVTAGIYLLIRFSALIDKNVIIGLFFVGSITSLMAGVNAVLETDMKKIIALSTLRQLGFITMASGLGFPSFALFHLLTHAVFKALLFMCGGKVIHEVGGTQDLRAIGGLSFFLPFTRIAINLSNLSLCGFPFLAGFYSKDLLAENILIGPVSGFSTLLLGVVVGLSTVYSVRLTIFRLLACSNMPSLSNRREEDIVIVKSKVLLCLISILFGAILSWLLFPVPPLVVLSLGLKLITLACIITGGLRGVVFSFWLSKGGLIIKWFKHPVVFLRQI